MSNTFNLAQALKARNTDIESIYAIQYVKYYKEPNQRAFGTAAQSFVKGSCLYKLHLNSLINDNWPEPRSILVSRDLDNMKFIEVTFFMGDNDKFQQPVYRLYIKE